ncbi:nicotinate-nucleotide--dimethylbenzimidazole phosphoribosyltransferase [Marinimicrobium sp. ARAG 43.8]|uniref:nicotinate-nucleotide--dimethylbenzimidazole phosphoribosyltransferase n=1 Tax=Marinimicrobium sp. ARAG 43.8 TaxID=3418719 RepID=UPI003CF481CB
MSHSTNIDWWQEGAAPLNAEALEAARTRQQQLTKPRGSLGQLERLAECFAAWQGKSCPSIEDVAVRVFAADHGVAAQGVSAYPQAVTAQMVANFCQGGAAISVLARHCEADFKVVNLGCVAPVSADPRLIDSPLGPGTADFTVEAAMTDHQLRSALDAGRDAVGQCDLWIGGEMGIGNTTSASAIQAALLSQSPEQVVGPGTGVDAPTLRHKQTVVAQSLERHADHLSDPMQTLRCLGGFEIAALTGAYIRCAQRGVPALVDGYITTVAALLAVRLLPATKDWLLFAHASGEPGHQALLAALDARPLLALDMRLGEGSGAALAVPLIRSALAMHREMATFESAGVSDG